MAQYSGMWTLSQVSQAVKNQTWTGLPPSVVEYLVVAGGGSGGGNRGLGGGGGAGGLLAGYVGIIPGTSYFVTVGAGGVDSAAANGGVGGNSVLVAASSGATTGNIVAFGGGTGAEAGVVGYSGASGGGGSNGSPNGYTGGSGIAGQGNAGGSGYYGNSPYGSGGGGGAGTIGLSVYAGLGFGANGGAGVASSISGSVVVYAGGGGGTSTSNIAINDGRGGAGGGGDGNGNNAIGYPGSVNSGGGGGGGYGGSPQGGGNGGSGIVIIRYPGTTQFFTGGTLSFANGYMIHTFYANGVLAPTTPTLYANPDYQIARSLRFNSADSAYLNRTPATATNRKTWTWSAWVKRSALGAVQELFDGYWANTDNGYFWVGFTSADKFEVQLYNSTLRTTTQVFRDPSAWYHFVLAVDTTQATAANRVKVYVNGSEITTFSTNNAPTQNLDTAVNYNGAHYIGTFAGTTNLFNGYMTEVNLIDGQALTPSSFGWTNPATGVWAPLDFVGTYGTNGFNLNFSDNTNTTAATLGADSSGNGNNWTPNNFSVTAGAGNDSLVDTPTSYGTDTGVGGEVRGNYCTWNPLQNSGLTLSDGNLTNSYSTAAWVGTIGTMAMDSGKWYFEFTNAGPYSDYQQFGIMKTGEVPFTGGQPTNGTAYGWIYSIDGYLGHNNAYTAAGITGYNTVGNVAMVAVDVSSGKIWFGRNGTWFNSGSPSTGTNAAYTDVSGPVVPTIYQYASSGVNSGSTNFGQRPFAYTAPSGFQALCTQNLPTPTIGATSTTLANKFFGVNTWAGTGATQVIGNAGFQPDWVWIKSRSASASHYLVDSVRGVANYLFSDSTSAEYTFSPNDQVTSLNASGFTLGADTNGGTNYSGRTFVGWQWRASNASAVTNTSGSITSQVSANPTSGFSIVTYTGTGVNATVGHGLGVAPSMIIVKTRSNIDGWFVYHKEIGNTNYLRLNTTAASTAFNLWQSTSPTSTVFSVAIDPTVNANTYTYVAYCFAPIAGYSAFGSYIGNGSADGPFVHLGFRPRFVIFKRAVGGTGSWYMEDSTRNTYNPTGLNIEANANNAEADYSPTFDFLSNGLKVRNTYSGFNVSTDTYVYMAFAENPFKYSLAR